MAHFSVAIIGSMISRVAFTTWTGRLIDRLVAWKNSQAGMFTAAGFLFAAVFHIPKELITKAINYFSGK